MLPQPRSIAIACSVVVAGALLAGCGGNSSTDSSPTPASQSPSHSPSGAKSTRPPSTDPSSPTSPPPATEFSPPGDIPDNQAFVSYSPPGAPFTVKVPEGWARSTKNGAVTFTDKLNSITMETVAARSAPTVQSVRANELPKIANSASQYSPGQISQVSRTAGPAILVTYQQDSAPDPVTNKVVRDAVERYEFWQAGKEVVLTLTGPKNADNVDPWRIVTDSLRWHST